MAKREGPLGGSPLAFDVEAERALIATVLYRPELAAEIVGGGGLRPESFHDATCREAFAAIAALVDRGEPCDLRGIEREAFRRGGRLTAGALAALGGEVAATDWVGLALRVREGEVRRTLSGRLLAIAGKCGTADVSALRADLFELLDDERVAIRRAAEDRWEAIAAEIRSAYDAGEDDAVPSGLVGVDRRFGPWPRGSLVVLGARTSVGKTAMATTLATALARASWRVSYISVEMDRCRIGQRYIGALTGVSVQDLAARTLGDEEFERVAAATATPLALCTDDRSRTWADVRSRIRQHRRFLGGLDVAFVDYAQMVEIESAPGERRYEALGRLSRGLKALAKDLRCVVVALAQLRRVDDREEPRLEDLRESGNFEQDADLVWLLWRAKKDRATAGLAPVRLKVAKNRYGPVGEVTVHFRGAAMQFMEMAGDDDEDV